MKINVRTDFRGVMSALDQLQQDLRDRAISQSMQRTLELARTQMRRQITAAYSMKAAEVRERLRIKRAVRTGDGWEAELVADSRGRRGGGSLNVARFLAGGKGSRMTGAQARRKLKAGTLAPLKVKITKGSAKPLDAAFLGNKGRTVFARVGAGRYPIKAVQTIDVPQMFNARAVNAPVVQFIREKWPQILAREVEGFVRRFNGR